MIKVYLISCGEKQYKIGVTKRDISARIRELKTGNSNPFEVISTFESKWSKKIESTLHRKFKDKLINGEWFDLDDSDVNNFTNECIKIHQNLELFSTSNSWVVERGGYK